MSQTRSRAPIPRPPTRWVAATVVVLAAMASACGGTPSVTAEKDATATPIELGDGSPTTTRSRSATTAGGITGALVPPFTLDRTVWFDGYKIKLTTATVDPEDKILRIEGEAENDGPDDGSLYDQVRLEQDGVAVADGSIQTKSTVLAGSRNALTVEIRRLPATFAPETSTLVIGDAKHQHVRLPLKGGGTAVTGEPVVVADPPKEITAGGLHLAIDRLSVRGDDPEGHKQAPIESQFVVLEGSVRFDGPSTNFQTQNLSLLPPNGASQSAKYLNALPRQGSSEKVYVVFEMPSPTGGVYTMQVKGPFVYTDPRFGPNGPVTVDTRLTLPAYPPEPKTAAS
jgi:hypothetical protein